MKKKVLTIIGLIGLILVMRLAEYLIGLTNQQYDKNKIVATQTNNTIQNEMKKSETSDITIQQIMESEIILTIDEKKYGPDIDLYSTRDEEGNEWIYRREEKHIVLTKEGVLCQYITGNYREDVKYSGHKIVKTQKLSNDQIKGMTDKMEQLKEKKFDTASEEIEYTVSQNNTKKTVDQQELNGILEQYGITM